jgi:hypothetical protein
MAAVTSAVVAVGTAGYQIYNAEKQKKDAKDAIKAFNSQELNNPYENIRISTLKSDQQTQANLSSFATSVDTLQRGGSRTVLAGLPKINEANIALQNQISSDLEKQDIQRDILIARGEAEIRNIREGREQLALQGLGQQLQTARQDSANGVVNLVSGALSLGSALNNQGTTANATENTTQTTTDTPEVFNTNKTVIGDTFVQQPAATVENAFANPNIPFGYNDANLFGNNPLVFGT